MTGAPKEVVVVEIPTEAGTHWHGQSKASKALKRTGLQERLECVGYNVTTVPALEEPQLWQPAQKSQKGVQDEEAVFDTMQKVFDTLSSTLRPGGRNSGRLLSAFPLVIGGPYVKIGILYVDNDADLTLPDETSALGSTAILDSMVLSHLTQRPGALESMKAYVTHDRKPLVTSDNNVLIGIDVTQTKLDHFTYLLDNHFRVHTGAAVKEDSVGRMKDSLSYLDDRCDAIFIHFDVDVIDSAEWPLGNYPSYGGFSLQSVMSALHLAIKNERIVGMIVTELNLNNDPSGEMVEQLVQGSSME